MKIKEEELVIVKEPRDKIQPYRVVNLSQKVAKVKNEPEIMYFCKTRAEAVQLIKKHREEQK